MARHYISEQEGVGYIVVQLDTEENWFLSTRNVCCFGWRQSDAMEFRDDCNSGKIEDGRIKYLMDKYTDEPYQYLGKGRIRKLAETGGYGSTGR